MFDTMSVPEAAYEFKWLTPVAFTGLQQAGKVELNERLRKDADQLITNFVGLSDVYKAFSPSGLKSLEVLAQNGKIVAVALRALGDTRAGRSILFEHRDVVENALIFGEKEAVLDSSRASFDQLVSLLTLMIKKADAMVERLEVESKRTKLEKKKTKPVNIPDLILANGLICLYAAAGGKPTISGGRKLGGDGGPFDRFIAVFFDLMPRSSRPSSAAAISVKVKNKQLRRVARLQMNNHQKRMARNESGSVRD